MNRTIIVLGCALALAGCKTVGPNYLPPRAAVTDEWLEPADPGAIDPAWWNRFGDHQLTALIEQAMAGSPTVAEARARLAEARANRDAVLGKRLPQVNATGSATENRISENGQLPVANIPGFEPEFSLFDLGFDASWEIDFWGRRTREAQGAEARAQVAEARLDETLVTLTGEIARNYMDLRAAQADAASARDSATAAADLARLTALRYRAGESNKLDADRAAADAATAQARVPQAQAQEGAAAYRLAALVGVAPEAIVPHLRADAPIPAAPETILFGLRSELLRRRPDVRAAERDLAAASADIGVAIADLFPRFSLMGGLGTQSRSVDGVFDPGSLRFSIGPSFSWPIFSFGRIRSHIRAAESRNDAAAARYERAVYEALSDSESAINRYLDAQRAEADAERALTAQQDAFDLARRRFKAGEDDRLALNRASLQLASSRTAASQSRAETARAAVAVYKALGGAWLSQTALKTSR